MAEKIIYKNHCTPQEQADFTTGNDRYYLDSDVVNTHETAVHYADKVIIFNYPNSSLVDDFMKLKVVKKHIEKVSIIDWNDEASPDYFTIANKLDEVLTS